MEIPEPQAPPNLLQRAPTKGAMHHCKKCNRKHRRHSPCPVRAFVETTATGVRRGVTTRPYGPGEVGDGS